MDQNTYNLLDLVNANFWGLLTLAGAAIGIYLTYILARPKIKISMRAYRLSESHVVSTRWFPVSKSDLKGRNKSVDIEFIEISVHNRRSSEVSLSEIGFTLELISEPTKRNEKPPLMQIEAPAVKGSNAEAYSLKPIKMASHETKRFLMPVWASFDFLRNKDAFLPMRIRASVSVLDSEIHSSKRKGYILTREENSLFDRGASIDFETHLLRSFIKIFGNKKLDLNRLKLTVRAITDAMNESPIDSSVEGVDTLNDAPTSAVEVFSRHFRKKLRLEDLYLPRGTDIEKLATHVRAYILSRSKTMVDTSLIHDEFLWESTRIRAAVVMKVQPEIEIVLILPDDE